MAIFVRVLALALLSTLASAWFVGEEKGFGICPDFRKDTDDTVDYSNPIATAAVNTRLEDGMPLVVIAGAESLAAREFSCISLKQSGASYALDYYLDGQSNTRLLTWDDGVIKGNLPKNLLNNRDEEGEATFVVTSYDDAGIIVMKSCRQFIGHHYTSTYILADSTIDAAVINKDCMVSTIDEIYGIESWPKGVCL